MTKSGMPITEDELHAYVDGVLPRDRVAEVEKYLAANPDAASQVASWRKQIELVREKWGAIAEEPVPERLKIENVTIRKGGNFRRMAAAALVAFIAGTGAGWLGRDLSEFGKNTDIARALADAAIEAHRLYVAEVRHPIEVRADEAHLVPWLSRRVGSQLKAPDLQPEGLKLLGGRLLSGPRGPTALLMYEGTNGERVTLTTARARREGESAFEWKYSGEIGAVAWFENGLAFVVAGPAERERLSRVARKVFDAYEVAENVKK